MSDSEEQQLKGRHLIVGVSGGISAFKSVSLVSSFVKAGAEVEVILTRSGKRFVGNWSFQGLTGRSVRTSVFDRVDNRRAIHVELGLWAHAYVIAPATARTLSKCANGLAEDLLSATFLTVQCPVLMAPAMNSRMWLHPAVQANVKRLKDFDVEFVGPAEGRMACGEPGPGRMVEPDEIYQAVVRRLESNGG